MNTFHPSTKEAREAKFKKLAEEKIIQNQNMIVKHGLRISQML